MGGGTLAGIEVLCEQRAHLVAGSRVALLCHAASVDSRLRHAAEVLNAAGARVMREFAPEHGVAAGLQDMEAVDETLDPLTGIPVISLYGEDEASLTPSIASLDGVDAVVVDLMDVGARYYTFVATAVRLLEVAARAGVRVLVADRPNPIDGVTVEGNRVDPRYRSFVSELDVPNRHGMTLGELCRWARRQRGIDVELDVVPVRGWRREQYWDASGLPWVQPSPNMPTLDTALVYPGACLVEATNLSEGRGTTRPFEWIGAPFLEGRTLARHLAARNLPGVVFRPISFVPAFHKHAGRACGGVQIHVTDRRAFRPLRTGLEILAACRSLGGDAFAWREEPYEFVSDRPALDLLGGGPQWRQALEAGADPAEMEAAWQAEQAEFLERRRPALLY
ncbi:MAG: DUF1343 domain-containing protein [Acidobacteriota bacterium]|nr:DUF1343 domain-containing protein [Acidobacteriota bacterium]